MASAWVTKTLPFEMLSRYPAMTFVSGSSAIARMTSSSSTSALLPTLTSLLKPMPFALAMSSTAASSAPDCETYPVTPSAGMSLAKLALSLLAGTMTPRQLGPMTLMPPCLAI